MPSSAQNKFEAFVSPSFSYRNLRTLNGTSSDYKDSLGKMDRGRHNWGGGLKTLLFIDKYTYLQIGVEYKGISFTRVREDLQFHDTVHPEIGRIWDLSQTVLSKDAFFYHKYRYLSVPVIYQKAFSRKKIHPKMQFYFASGLNFDFLFTDETRVTLYGWSVGGESMFKIPNDYTSSTFNLTLDLGGRFEYLLNERSSFSVQPAFKYPLLSTAKDDLVEFNIFQVGLQVGVNYSL